MAPGAVDQAPGAVPGPVPEPGGWNRIQLSTADLDTHVEVLRAARIALRNEVVEGRGGRQILTDDPSGNPIEHCEPAGP